jgi:hypothetical protein
VSRNQLESLAGLQNLRRLESASVASNKLSSLCTLGRLDALTSLDVSQNQLSSLRGLTGCTSLSEITANANQLADLRGIARCKALVELQVRCGHEQNQHTYWARLPYKYPTKCWGKPSICFLSIQRICILLCLALLVHWTYPTSEPYCRYSSCKSAKDHQETMLVQGLSCRTLPSDQACRLPGTDCQASKV